MEDDGEAEVNPMHDEWILDIPPAVLNIADAVVILRVLCWEDQRGARDLRCVLRRILTR